MSWFKTAVFKVRCTLRFCLFFSLPFLYYRLNHQWFFLVGFRHLGDNIIGLLPLNEWLSRDRRKIVAIIPKSQAFLAKWYPQFTKIKLISDKRNTSLFFSEIRFVADGVLRRKAKGGFVCPRLNEPLRYPLYTCTWFPYKTATKPKIQLSGVAEKHLSHGKTIMIIPDSYSFQSKKISAFLHDAAQKFVSLGYTVILNTKNTAGYSSWLYGDHVTTLYPSLEWLAANAETFSAIVGIRTGLMDLLCSTCSAARIVACYDNTQAGIWNLNSYPLTWWGPRAMDLEICADNAMKILLDYISNSNDSR